MKNVEISGAAERDVAQALGWYERQRPGLGAEFLQALEDCLQLVAQYPAARPAVTTRLRRANLKRFPYAVFFERIGDDIRVVACLHAKRDHRHILRTR